MRSRGMGLPARSSSGSKLYDPATSHSIDSAMLDLRESATAHVLPASIARMSLADRRVGIRAEPTRTLPIRQGILKTS